MRLKDWRKKRSRLDLPLNLKLPKTIMQGNLPSKKLKKLPRPSSLQNSPCKKRSLRRLSQTRQPLLQRVLGKQLSRRPSSLRTCCKWRRRLDKKLKRKPRLTKLRKSLLNRKLQPLFKKSKRRSRASNWPSSKSRRLLQLKRRLNVRLRLLRPPESRLSRKLRRWTPSRFKLRKSRNV